MLTGPAKETTNRQSGRPLFVLGVPRSGTSLLYVLLNQHPEIRLMHEADLPMLQPLFLKRRSKLQWLERWNLYNEGPQRHQLDIGNIPSDISDIRTATEAAYQEFASQKGAGIWGEKSPNQYDQLRRLASRFPNARFILIWRDPADVCRSMIRAREESIRFKQQGGEDQVVASPHFAHGGLTHRALLGYPEMGAQRDRLRARGVPVHDLHYDELVKNPVAEMQKICQFLGISFHPGMATLKNADSSAIPQAQHNALVKGDNIVATRKRSEVLPADLRRKIERYKNLWRQRDFAWAKFPALGDDSATPSFAEGIVDRIRYRLLRVWDSIVVFGFCLAPLSWLLAYRAWKKHPYVNSTWQNYIRGRSELNNSREVAVRTTLLPMRRDEPTMSSVDVHQ